METGTSTGETHNCTQIERMLSEMLAPGWQFVLVAPDIPLFFNLQTRESGFVPRLNGSWSVYPDEEWTFVNIHTSQIRVLPCAKNPHPAKSDHTPPPEHIAPFGEGVPHLLVPESDNFVRVTNNTVDDPEFGHYIPRDLDPNLLPAQNGQQLAHQQEGEQLALLKKSASIEDLRGHDAPVAPTIVKSLSSEDLTLRPHTADTVTVPVFATGLSHLHSTGLALQPLDSDVHTVYPELHSARSDLSSSPELQPINPALVNPDKEMATRSPSPDVNSFLSAGPDLNSVHGASPDPTKVRGTSPDLINVHSTSPDRLVHSTSPDLINVHSTSPDRLVHSTSPDLINVHSTSPDLNRVHSTSPVLVAHPPSSFFPTTALNHEPLGTAMGEYLLQVAVPSNFINAPNEEILDSPHYITPSSRHFLHSAETLAPTHNSDPASSRSGSKSRVSIDERVNLEEPPKKGVNFPPDIVERRRPTEKHDLVGPISERRRPSLGDVELQLARSSKNRRAPKKEGSSLAVMSGVTSTSASRRSEDINRKRDIDIPDLYLPEIRKPKVLLSNPPFHLPYYYEIDGESAQDILYSAAVGSFLLRPSTTPNVIALCVKTSNTDVVIYRLNYRDGMVQVRNNPYTRPLPLERFMKNQSELCRYPVILNKTTWLPEPVRKPNSKRSAELQRDYTIKSLVKYPDQPPASSSMRSSATTKPVAKDFAPIGAIAPQKTSASVGGQKPPTSSSSSSKPSIKDLTSVVAPQKTQPSLIASSAKPPVKDLAPKNPTKEPLPPPKATKDPTKTVAKESSGLRMPFLTSKTTPQTSWLKQSNPSAVVPPAPPPPVLPVTTALRPPNVGSTASTTTPAITNAPAPLKKKDSFVSKTVSKLLPWNKSSVQQGHSRSRSTSGSEDLKRPPKGAREDTGRVAEVRMRTPWEDESFDASEFLKQEAPTEETPTPVVNPPAANLSAQTRETSSKNTESNVLKFSVAKTKTPAQVRKHPGFVQCEPEAVEKLLQGQPSGTFLLRSTNVQGMLVLSVVLSKQVKHYSIFYNEEFEFWWQEGLALEFRKAKSKTRPTENAKYTTLAGLLSANPFDVTLRPLLKRDFALVYQE